MQQPHVNASCALGTAPETVGFQDVGKVYLVSFLTALTGRSSVKPGIVTAACHPGNSAHPADVEHIAVPFRCLSDERVLYPCRCFDSHSFRASVFAICSFFKNSTSCFAYSNSWMSQRTRSSRGICSGAAAPAGRLL